MHSLLRHFARGTAVVICLAATASMAEKAPLWKEVGNWQVRVDSSLGFGCFIVTSYTKGTALRVGFDQKNKTGYFMVNNAAWRSLEKGKDYNIKIQFDDEAPWQGAATSTDMGLVIKLTKANFLVEMARKQDLFLWYRDKLVTRLPLTGSKAALDEMIACQTRIDAARNSPNDPFAKRAPTDPFSEASDRGPVQLDPFRR